jgi:drug/metabolite transporter (DMT)-like permease
MRAVAVTRVSPTVAGIALTLASAVFLSGLAITTKLAFDAGATVGTLLPGRFLVAAAVLWPIVLLLRPQRLTRRQVVAGLVLGVGFSAHAALFSASLARLDAGLVDLLLFTYPALVMLGAVALRRDRWSGRRALALATAGAGTTLVLLGGVGSIDPAGAGLALGASVAYAAYILASAGQLERTNPILLTALATTGAAITLTVATAARGEISFGTDPAALALIAAVGVVALAGMFTFIGGIGRLGPARASIVSAVQPAITPVLGFAAFGDRLGPEQMLGGVMVVAAVVILEARDLAPGLRFRLASLLRPERRRLARLGEAVEVSAGERLVRQGAPAEAFFVIERGRASVEQDDRHLRDLGPGDFFGEVALLRGGPRTASVVAEAETRLRVIPRREFARAMRGLPGVARAVKATASERLAPSPPRLATAR